MEELIKITKSDQGENLVSARDLHEFLGSKRDFSGWIKDRITKYGFVENQDFVTLTKIVERATRIEYALKMDMAKELAMVEGNAKGKIARRYFIACEKKLQEVTKPLSTLDFLQMQLDQMKVQDKRISEVENRVNLIEAKSTTQADYVTVMGYAILNKIKVPLSKAAQYGRQATKICKQAGFEIDKIRDPRFGIVNVYPTEVLNSVFNISIT